MVHPRVARWIELHRIRTTDRSNGFAIRTESSFNGKRTDDERRGGREGEREALFVRQSIVSRICNGRFDGSDRFGRDVERTSLDSLINLDGNIARLFTNKRHDTRIAMRLVDIYTRGCSCLVDVIGYNSVALVNARW